MTGLADLQSAAAVREVFERAAEANLQTSGRSGCVVDLPKRGKLLISGDLHDHREHFERLLKLARLGASSNYHIVLQELVHGDHLVNGMDFSYRLMARAAQLKCQFPDQVHYLLSNHELAQVCGDGILKDSVSVVEAFDEGLEYVFGEEAEHVAGAIKRFVRTLPLAVRCANGVFCAHSLPGPRKREVFDVELLKRQPNDEDLCGMEGSAHLMVWGRGLTQKLADDLAAAWETSLFVLGHQPAEMGWSECGQSILIINSDHEHGVALPIELARSYSRDELIEQLLPLNGVVL